MRAVFKLALAVVLTAALSACGGGGSPKAASDATSSGADDTHGALTLGLSGGAYRDVGHVWVTIGTVALHTSATQAWSSADRSWTVLRLAKPVVIDLAVLPTATQGDVTPVISGLSVPAGTYAQIRLFPLAHDAALDDAASAKGLSYNAQVNYTDAGSQAHVVPLELSQPELGWRMAGSFSVSANSASYLVAQSDLQHDLVRMASPDGVDHFSYRPRLQHYDMNASGVILGSIDPAKICGTSTAPAAPNCAEDIVVSAQSLSSDGQRHVSVRQYRMTRSDGGFALYPLPEGSTHFDVVITGRRMQTMLIRDVAVTASPIIEWTTGTMTTLGSSTAPLSPVIVPTALRTVNLASAMSPASSQLYFGQTMGAGTKPFEVAVANVDVLNGTLAQALDLPQGPVSVATFAQSGAALSFTDTVPQEGSDALSVMALGTAYDDAGATTLITPPLGAASTIAVANPSRQAGLGTGQIQVNVTGSLSASYDVVQLVVSDAHGVVATQAVSGPGSVLVNVPAGSQASAIGGTAVYMVALRAAGHTGSLRWVRAGSTADLRSLSSASVSLALP